MPKQTMPEKPSTPQHRATLINARERINARLLGAVFFTSFASGPRLCGLPYKSRYVLFFLEKRVMSWYFSRKVLCFFKEWGMLVLRDFGSNCFMANANTFWWEVRYGYFVKGSYRSRGLKYHGAPASNLKYCFSPLVLSCVRRKVRQLLVTRQFEMRYENKSHYSIL